MRAVRHIPIIPMAMLAPIASRPRIMAPHRAIISTIRTLPRLHRNMTRKAASAPAYTKSTGEERFADYYAEEKALRFSEFPQAVKVAFIAIVIALLGVIAFEGFRLFSGPTQAESETQQKENDDEYLDINTLKGDPNDGDDE